MLRASKGKAHVPRHDKLSFDGESFRKYQIKHYYRHHCGFSRVPQERQAPCDLTLHVCAAPPLAAQHVCVRRGNDCAAFRFAHQRNIARSAFSHNHKMRLLANLREKTTKSVNTGGLGQYTRKKEEKKHTHAHTELRIPGAQAGGVLH